MEKTHINPAILILTHGDFGREIIRSAELINGAVDRVEAISLVVGMDPDDFLAKIAQTLEKYDNNVFAFIDMVGGTPFNSWMRICQSNPAISGVAGFNMPMLLEALVLREKYTGSELAAQLCTRGQSCILNISGILERLHKHESGVE